MYPPTETVLTGYHVNFSDSGLDFGPRDLSQRLRNGRAMLVGRFSRPGDHSRPISGHFGDFGPDPLSETSTSVLSQQQTSVLSQQQTSVLSQQQTSVLSQQKTSILSQQKTSQQPAGGRQLSRLLLRQDRCLLFRKALALPGRAVLSGAPRRGLTRGEESEEGGSVHC